MAIQYNYRTVVIIAAVGIALFAGVSAVRPTCSDTGMSTVTKSQARVSPLSVGDGEWEEVEGVGRLARANSMVYLVDEGGLPTSRGFHSIVKTDKGLVGLIGSTSFSLDGTGRITDQGQADFYQMLYVMTLP